MPRTEEIWMHQTGFQQRVPGAGIGWTPTSIPTNPQKHVGALKVLPLKKWEKGALICDLLGSGDRRIQHQHWHTSLPSWILYRHSWKKICVRCKMSSGYQLIEWLSKLSKIFKQNMIFKVAHFCNQSCYSRMTIVWVRLLSVKLNWQKCKILFSLLFWNARVTL